MAEEFVQSAVESSHLLEQKAYIGAKSTVSSDGFEGQIRTNKSPQHMPLNTLQALGVSKSGTIPDSDGATLNSTNMDKEFNSSTTDHTNDPASLMLEQSIDNKDAIKDNTNPSVGQAKHSSTTEHGSSTEDKTITKVESESLKGKRTGAGNEHHKFKYTFVQQHSHESTGKESKEGDMHLQSGKSSEKSARRSGESLMSESASSDEEQSCSERSPDIKEKKTDKHHRKKHSKDKKKKKKKHRKKEKMKEGKQEGSLSSDEEETGAKRKAESNTREPNKLRNKSPVKSLKDDHHQRKESVSRSPTHRDRRSRSHSRISKRGYSRSRSQSQRHLRKRSYSTRDRRRKHGVSRSRSRSQSQKRSRKRRRSVERKGRGRSRSRSGSAHHRSHNSERKRSCSPLKSVERSGSRSTINRINRQDRNGSRRRSNSCELPKRRGRRSHTPDRTPKQRRSRSPRGLGNSSRTPPQIKSSADRDSPQRHTSGSPSVRKSLGGRTFSGSKSPRPQVGSRRRSSSSRSPRTQERPQKRKSSTRNYRRRRESPQRQRHSTSRFSRSRSPKLRESPQRSSSSSSSYTILDISNQKEASPVITTQVPFQTTKSDPNKELSVVATSSSQSEKKLSSDVCTAKEHPKHDLDSCSANKSQQEKPRKTSFSVVTRNLALPSLMQDTDEDENDVDFFQRMLIGKTQSPKKKSKSSSLTTARSPSRQKIVEDKKDIVGDIFEESKERSTSLTSAQAELCGKKETDRTDSSSRHQRCSLDLDEVFDDLENKEYVSQDSEQSPDQELWDLIDKGFPEKDVTDNVLKETIEVREDLPVLAKKATKKEKIIEKRTMITAVVQDATQTTLVQSSGDVTLPSTASVVKDATQAMLVQSSGDVTLPNSLGQNEENRPETAMLTSDPHQEKDKEEHKPGEKDKSAKEKYDPAQDNKAEESSEKEDPGEEMKADNSATHGTMDEKPLNTSHMLSNFRSHSDSIPLLGEGIPPLQPPPPPPVLPQGMIPLITPPPPLLLWGSQRHVTAQFHGGAIQHRPFVRGPTNVPNYDPSPPWGPSGHGPLTGTNQRPGLLPHGSMNQNIARSAVTDVGQKSKQMTSGAVSKDTGGAQGIDLPVDMEMSSPESDIIEQMNKEFWKSQAKEDSPGSAEDSHGEPNIKDSFQESVEDENVERSLVEEKSDRTSDVYDPEEEMADLEPISQERIEEVEKLRQKETKRRSERRDKTFQRLLNKPERQMIVATECKLVLKQYYKHNEINKDEYKEILRKVVPQVANSHHSIDSDRIRRFVKRYVAKIKAERVFQEHSVMELQ